MTDDDPLARLLMDDADEVDRAAIAATLQDLVAVDSKSGRLALKPAFDNLPARARVLVYLLGARVAVLLGKRGDEHVLPKEIIEITGMPAGTVRPKLAELLEARLVSHSDDGAYTVAPHQVGRAIAALAPARDR
jgi:hypothetical protein